MLNTKYQANSNKISKLPPISLNKSVVFNQQTQQNNMKISLPSITEKSESFIKESSLKPVPKLSASYKKANRKLSTTYKNVTDTNNNRKISTDYGNGLELSDGDNKMLKSVLLKKKRGSLYDDKTRSNLNKSKLSNKAPSPLNSLLEFYEDEDDKETYEDHLHKLKNAQKRIHSPLFDSIWSEELFDLEKENQKKNDIENMINFKFGSNLSDDGRYAMLKTYEDMIYFELQSIYPDMSLVSSLERTKTEFFKRLPRKQQQEQQNHQNTVKLPQIQSNNHVINHNHTHHANTTTNKDKFNCSKEFEKAMKIYDGIKKQKGELTTTTNYYNKNNLLGAYNAWKTNCFNKIIN